MGNNLEFASPPEQINVFLPLAFPRVYQDGRIPLRVQVFNDKLVLHNVLTKPKKGVYMCSHCDTTFASFVQLLDHIDANDIKRPYKCSHDDCPWKIVGFNRIRQLKRHIGSVHTTTKDYRCPVEGCSKSFARVDLFNRHMKAVHENKLSRFNTKLQNRRRSSSASVQSSSSLNGSISSTNSSPTLAPASAIQSQQQETQPQKCNKYKYSIRFLTE